MRRNEHNFRMRIGSRKEEMEKNYRCMCREKGKVKESEELRVGLKGQVVRREER